MYKGSCNKGRIGILVPIRNNHEMNYSESGKGTVDAYDELNIPDITTELQSVYNK